jgi:hypothetical protein
MPGMSRATAALYLAADRGVMPTPPDFSKRSYACDPGSLAELIALVEAGDPKALRSYVVRVFYNGAQHSTDSGRWVVTAIEARRAAAAEWATRSSTAEREMAFGPLFLRPFRSLSRERGGTRRPFHHATVGTGLSPRARGNGKRCGPNCGSLGSIPASAGERLPFKTLISLMHNYKQRA